MTNQAYCHEIREFPGHAFSWGKTEKTQQIPRVGEMD
jgi:hypothetical protein